MSVIAEWIPASNIVTGITNALNAQVTTQTPHGYSVGAFVRLNVPIGYGMDQISGSETLIVTVPSPTTFVCNLNTSIFPPFAAPMNAKQQAQVIPIGEVAQSLKSSKRNVLGNAPDIDF